MTDYTLERENLTQLLHDADCPEEFTQRFLKTMETGTTGDQLRLLRIQRSRQLDRVHAEEKKLDLLDFLRYRLEKPVAAK